MSLVRNLVLATISVFASATAYASDQITPVEEAVAMAQEFKDLAVSFSMRASSPSEPHITMRYDADTNTWSILEGTLDGLDEETLEELEEVKTEVSKPGELTYADALDELSIVGLKEENADALIYLVDLNDEDDPMPQVMKEAIDATLHVDKSNGQIALLSMRSREPFKPAMVAKIDTLIIEQAFTSFPELGIGLLSRYHNKVDGEAMFQKFTEEFTLEFFDYAVSAE